MLDTIERLRPALADRYLLERELGKGGMATVFLARDLKHDREVAIKVLHPELSASIGAERFEREIRLAAKLQHPHILGLYDSGQADNLLYYVMPFVRGESLRDLLEREGQLPIEDALQYTLEVADALGYAHAQGIIHRDIKPENVLISGGHALVADFGIARAAQESGGQKLTQTGMAVGTPVYMSPEQASGDHVGPTSDIYSLGCMLYELLAGEPPFTAKTAAALLARHAMEAVPSVRIVRNTVPEEVEDAIFAAMAKVPADRPKDAAHFAEMLGMPLGGTATRRAAIRHTASRRVPTGAFAAAPPPPPPWWRKPWVMAAGVLVVVGIGFAAWKASAGPSGTRLSTAAVARARRIAVLYFTAEGDPELRPAADRLTESLIRSLAAVQGLTVIGRNGVAPYRGDAVPLDSIARALSVGTLVTGSVELEGQNVRISTRLRDEAGAPLAASSSSFVLPRDSLMAAEDSVAAEVARSLKPRIGAEVQLAESQASTSSLEAWTLQNRAENSRKQGAELAAAQPERAAVMFAEADTLLAQASEADPGWVEPMVLRGEVALQRARLEREPTARMPWIQRARQEAERALAIDGSNARALALRGSASYAEWDTRLTTDPAERAALLKSAETDLQDAVDKDGTLASAYATLSFVYYSLKDVSNALIMARNAYTADRFLSNSALVLYRLYLASYDTQQFRDARNYCAEGAARFPRDWRFVSCRLWLMLPVPGHADSIPVAWALAAKADSLGTRMQSRIDLMLVGGIIGKAARSGNTRLADSARKVLARAAEPDPELDPTQELMGYEAIMLVQMGELDEAMSRLKRYVALNPDHSFQVDGNTHWWWRELVNRSDFRSLLKRQ